MFLFRNFVLLAFLYFKLEGAGRCSPFRYQTAAPLLAFARKQGGAGFRLLRVYLHVS
jgi:hypothetical protein